MTEPYNSPSLKPSLGRLGAWDVSAVPLTPGMGEIIGNGQIGIPQVMTNLGTAGDLKIRDLHLGAARCLEDCRPRVNARASARQPESVGPWTLRAALRLAYRVGLHRKEEWVGVWSPSMRVALACRQL